MQPATYKGAGVDIRAGDELVRRLKKLCPDIGGFGGLYPLGNDFLVAGADGVGTKLKIAFAKNRHRTVGIDLVAMNVNDILVSGARPLFFLDYFATSKLDVDQAQEVLQGILQGCEEAGCLLLGGETAEMPGFYREGEYDLAGFVVGIVAKEKLVDGRDLQAGDALVSIASSGLHSNGFSLVRHLLEKHRIEPDDALLEPTRIYCKKIREIEKFASIKAMAHITGGGLYENIPRMFQKGLGAELIRNSWPVPELFGFLQRLGNIDENEMFSTFNMGVGFVMALSQKDAEKICSAYPDCSLIGHVVAHEGVSWK